MLRLLLPLAALLAAGPALAQPAPAPDSAWAAAVRLSEAPPVRSADRAWLGSGMGVTSGGLGMAGGLTYTRAGHVLSLRGAMSVNPLAEVFCFLGAPETDCPPSMMDGGLLYGRALVDTPDAFVSVGAGVGAAQAIREGAPVTFAVPVEVQAQRVVAPWLGLGVYGFASLNGTRSFGGIALSVQVGELR